MPVTWTPQVWVFLIAHRAESFWAEWDAQQAMPRDPKPQQLACPILIKAEPDDLTGVKAPGSLR